ncbi:MAG: DNA repair protein RecO [Deltaproteobacteria bacterium]
MEWRDQGIVLSVRKHGETSAIVEVLTLEHGRHAGVVKGGTSRKMTPHLQPGSELDLTWRARLDEHLGTFSFEPLKAHSGLMGDRLALTGLLAVTSLIAFALPEREAHPVIHNRTAKLLDLMEGDSTWPLAYLMWEMALLEDMGFGLDLETCAVTGAVDELVYVSPKSGRAVSRVGAGIWADRMLPLPACLSGGRIDSDADIDQGLVTTGYFLEHRLAHMTHRQLPAARARFIELFQRQFARAARV